MTFKDLEDEMNAANSNAIPFKDENRFKFKIPGAFGEAPEIPKPVNVNNDDTKKTLSQEEMNNKINNDIKEILENFTNYYNFFNAISKMLKYVKENYDIEPSISIYRHKLAQFIDSIEIFIKENIDIKLEYNTLENIIVGSPSSYMANGYISFVTAGGRLTVINFKDIISMTCARNKEVESILNFNDIEAFIPFDNV